MFLIYIGIAVNLQLRPQLLESTGTHQNSEVKSICDHISITMSDLVGTVVAAVFVSVVVFCLEESNLPVRMPMHRQHFFMGEEFLSQTSIVTFIPYSYNEVPLS